MIGDNETSLLGIPVPSDNKIFLTIVVIHILLGMGAVISGLVAMVNNKTGGTHRKAGKIYVVLMLLIFLTVLPLSIMRWPHNIHLLILGTLAFVFTLIGRKKPSFSDPKRSRLHTLCMGLSYILLLTAFYVDNGKNLPFWKQFPQLFFYIFPSAIGLPIIIYTLLRHPLNRS
jgi:hypothetical protein